MCRRMQVLIPVSKVFVHSLWNRRCKWLNFYCTRGWKLVLWWKPKVICGFNRRVISHVLKGKSTCLKVCHYVLSRDKTIRARASVWVKIDDQSYGLMIIASFTTQWEWELLYPRCYILIILACGSFSETQCVSRISYIILHDNPCKRPSVLQYCIVAELFNLKR